MRRSAMDADLHDLAEAPARPVRTAEHADRESVLREFYASRRESQGDDAPPAPRRSSPADADANAQRPVRPAVQDSPREDAARRRDLLSPGVDAAVTAAFQSLGDVVLPHKERTVEDLVKEILRPMLKDWLDHNLPAIVERLVRAEIERVARQPR